MRPWCMHFGGGRNARKTEKLIVKIQQAAANNIISSSTWYFCLKSQPTKKKKKRGEKLERLLRRTVVPGIRITASRTLWTTTNKLEAGAAAKGRDNEGQMRRAHVCFSGLVATSDVPGTCPTQKLPLIFNPIHMGPRKTNIVFRGSPDRGGILTSSKNTENNTWYLV